MIEFMVIGNPRSGTTWAANWLCTDTTHCLHDPFATVHYQDWNKVKSNKMLGVSDTGIAIFHQWLNNHPARKVILHRDMQEIFSQVPEFEGLQDNLDKIDGMHVHFTDLFNNPKRIYEFLLQKEFDAERHQELKNIQMQPMAEEMHIDRAVIKKIMDEIKGIAHV